jgi:3-oxoacyl-[acyl-carrier protein] reductase
MKINLSGRAAIVTGGSKGIGFAVATRFAASGADVAIVARTGEPLKEGVAVLGSRARVASSGFKLMLARRPTSSVPTTK